MSRHPGLNPLPFETIVTGKDDNSLLFKESYCYPRGGGQPGDTGTIYSEGSRVSKLNEVLPGDMILHPIGDVSKFQIGQKVTCEIDVERRNGNTLMHTSQHIVSAIAEDLWGAETVGNQIGPEESRVDLYFENKEIFDSDILIDEVNSVISSKINVNVHNWDRKKILSHDQMRHTKFMHRIPESITHLRVVEIEGVDLCPCAGTHASNTTQIPKIKFVGKKNKGKGRLRVSYEFD